MNSTSTGFNGLDLLISVLVIVVGLYGLYLMCRSIAPRETPVDEDFEIALEYMRRAILRKTGREISELQRHKGHWYARTATGLEPVSDLLKAGKVDVSKMV